jgi:hypothetical protein
LLAATSGVAGAWGAWRWWTVRPDRTSWILLRASQAVAVVVAVAAGVFYLAGLEPPGHLYWLYALLPIPVSFVAEQLRLASAQAVLDQRGLSDAQAVGTLDEAGQRSVVLQIVRRELGTVSLAAIVVCFLALRAYSELR